VDGFGVKSVKGELMGVSEKAVRIRVELEAVRKEEEKLAMLKKNLQPEFD
jgi:hypothetical protein